VGQAPQRHEYDGERETEKPEVRAVALAPSRPPTRGTGDGGPGASLSPVPRSPAAQPVAAQSWPSLFP